MKKIYTLLVLLLQLYSTVEAQKDTNKILIQEMKQRGVSSESNSRLQKLKENNWIKEVFFI